MNMQKKYFLILLAILIIAPSQAMESGADDQGYFGRLLSLAKTHESVTIPAAMCAGALLIGYWLFKPAQDCSLTVYNMYDRVVIGCTDPVALSNRHNSEDSVIVPYQSFYDTRSVTYTLPDIGIKHFYYKGIAGLNYKIELNLKKGEQATLQILAKGSYKFKGTIAQAQEV